MKKLILLLLVSSFAFGQVNTTKKITFKEGETPKIGVVVSGLTTITRVEVTFRNSLNAVLRKFSTLDSTITLSDTTYTFSFTDLQTIGKAGRGTWQVEVRSEEGVKKTDVYTYEIYKATTLTGSTTPATAGGYNYLFEWDFAPTTPTFDVIASGIIVVDDVSISSALALKAPLANPTFTGTVSGVTKGMVGLGNVDNTSDANKPVSAATQTALDLKTGAVPLATYATMTALSTPTVPTYYKIAIDENKGINNSYYLWWPDGKRIWIAATDDN